MTAAYDPDNIFAKILRGEIPCFKVHEDEHALAFMDIMPRSPGHLLVIPKQPARNILDCDATSLSAVTAAVQKLARAAKAALDADGVTIQQFNETAGGQEIFHLHFHVLPRFAGVKLDPPGNRGDMGVISAQAEKIRAATAG